MLNLSKLLFLMIALSLGSVKAQGTLCNYNDEQINTHIFYIKQNQELADASGIGVRRDGYLEQRNNHLASLNKLVANRAASTRDIACINELLKYFGEGISISERRQKNSRGKIDISIGLTFMGPKTLTRYVSTRVAYQFIFRGESRLGQALLADETIELNAIRSSIMEHASPCPCPYSQDAVGAVCGDRSAYIQFGGRHPVCYKNQVDSVYKKAVRDAYIESFAKMFADEVDDVIYKIPK